MRNRVLRRRMWNLCDVLVVISKWSPIEEKRQPEMKYFHLWVIVNNVLRSMYACKGLGFLTSPVGEPKDLHADKSYNFAVEDGDNIRVTYDYPWLPARCTNYEKWGHKGRIV